MALLIIGPLTNILPSELENQLPKALTPVHYRIEPPTLSEVEFVSEIDVVIFSYPSIHDNPQSSKYVTLPKTTVSVLTAFINRYPYIPRIVVGEPPYNIMTKLLGEAVCLPNTATAKQLAKAVTLSNETTWWYAVNHLNHPFFIIDKDKTILRANSVARQRFNTNITGITLDVLLPKLSDADISHSIDAAKRNNKATCVTLNPTGKQGPSIQLTTIPIVGLKLRREAHVRAFGILLVELFPWQEILEAITPITDCKSIDEVYAKIVASIKERGYERVRLYELVTEPGHGPHFGLEVLKGRKCIGFEQDKDEDFQRKHKKTRQQYFEDTFKIFLDNDIPSKHSIKEATPTLFVFKGAEGSDLRPSQYVQFNKRDHKFFDELQFEQVDRWIEVPLFYFLPRGERNEKQVWGKISVDNGPNGKSLSETHLAELAMLGGLFSALLTTVTLLEKYKKSGEEFLDSATFVSSLFSPNVTDQVKATRGVLTKLFFKLTGHEIVYFRTLERDELRLDRDTIEARDYITAAEREAIPEIIRKGQRYSSKILEAEYVDENKNWKADRKPRVVRPSSAEDVQSIAAGMPEERVKFLGKFTAVLVPILAGSRLCGVIVGLTRSRIGEADLSVAQQFMYICGLWYLLATSYESRQKRSKLLQSVLSFANQLESLRYSNVNSFYSGVVTLLTAHDGLLWNRAIVAERSTAGSFVVRYAVGGDPTSDRDDDAKSHRELMESLERKYPVLNKLFDEVTKNPMRRDGSISDELFKKLVLQRFDLVKLNSENTADELEIESRLLGYAHQAPLELPSLNDLFVDFDKNSSLRSGSTGWYVFPLTSRVQGSNRLYGVVLVDLFYERSIHGDKEIDDFLEDRKLATVGFLSVVSEIMAQYDELLRNIVNRRVLMDERHGVGKKEDWDHLFASVMSLIDGDALSSDEKASIKGNLDSVNRWLENHFKALDVIYEGLPELRVEDVRGTIDDLMTGLQKRAFPNVRWDSFNVKTGALVRCDVKVFCDAIECLVRNASEASSGRIVTISFSDEELVIHGQQIWRLWVRNDGPLIDKDIVEFLFLERTTTKQRQSTMGRGRGLPLAQNQLSGYGGMIGLRRSPAEQNGIRPDFFIAFNLGIANYNVVAKGNRRVAD